LVDDTSTVRVAFRGIPPDLFGEGRGALVEGSYSADGVFQAKTILAPSKTMPLRMPGS
jgi:cytochrome c-type biogenesis protein CcmE